MKGEKVCNGYPLRSIRQRSYLKKEKNSLRNESSPLRLHFDLTALILELALAEDLRLHRRSHLLLVVDCLQLPFRHFCHLSSSQNLTRIRHTKKMIRMALRLLSVPNELKLQKRHFHLMFEIYMSSEKNICTIKSQLPHKNSCHPFSLKLERFL